MWLYGITYRHVIQALVKRAEGSTQVASFTLRRLLLQLEWIPPLALLGRNDIRFLLVVTNSNVQRIWRQVAATPVTTNGKRNVAAMIHRQAT